MRWQVNDVVNEFGRHLGIEDLALNDAGALVIQVDRIGRVSVEMVGQMDDRVSVSLSRSYQDPLPEEACRAAIESCHYRNNRSFQVHPAIAGTGGLAFAVCMNSGELSVQNLHQIIEELDQIHESMSRVAITND